MGHTLVGRQSVNLEGFGGLVTIAKPQDLPENASPRNYNVGFSVGGFAQRSGLVSSLVAPTLSNFLYAKTFLQPSGQVNSLVEDQNGNLWAEDVNSAPGILAKIFGGINPGSYMFGSTAGSREYMCFSNLPDFTQQGDRPRQWAGPGDTNFDPVSQCAPGVPPSFNATLGSGSSAAITSWSISSNVATFTAANNFTAGEIVTVSGLSSGSFMNNVTFTVLGTGLSGTQFQTAFTHANASATEAGTATPQYSYPLSSIAQPSPNPAGQINQMLWSDGPGSKNQGTVCTVYYAINTTYPTNPDTVLVTAFNSGLPCYVYINNAQFGNGTQVVTSIGNATPPGAQYGRWYFTFNMPSVGFQYTGSNPGVSGTYQITAATITAASPIPGVNIGDQIQITGAVPGGWNSTWNITKALNGGAMNITQTSVSGGVATYTWSIISGSAPTAGQLVTVTGTLNGNGVFNVTDGTILGVSGTTSGTFTIANFPSQSIPSAAEAGTATSSGTIFQIDPGIKTLGTTNNPVFGNSSTGNAIVVGGNSSAFPIAAGTRKGVVLFITRNGAVTPASVPATFTTGQNTNYIFANNIPIGPPDVIARAIAITEAGQNGVPGAFFYMIETPVTAVLNNSSITYSSTIVQDNTSTSAKFTFDEATLLNATEIDVTGLDFFNCVELGNSGWNISYANRMFYGLVQNKIYNFNNLSFDGGYLFNPFGTNTVPAGWNMDIGSNPAAGNPVSMNSFQIASNVATFQAPNNFIAGQAVGISGLSTGTYLNGSNFSVLAAGLSASQFSVAFMHADVAATFDSGTATPLNTPGTLMASAISGNSYYIKNNTGSLQTQYGMVTQTAYQDAYGVNILSPQVTYGVRVTARRRSANTSGNLVVDLTTSNTAVYGASGYGVAFGVTYEAFALSISQLTTSFQTFQGGLLTVPFTSKVPATLMLRVWAQNLPYGGDVEIDRIEIYPLGQPIGFPQDAVGVIGSYVNRPESFDINTGVIQLSLGNQQQVFGGAVFNDTLYFLKEASIASTSQTAGQEPGNWATTRVNDKVGACGIYSYDIGKEYLVTACRQGVFAFNGGEPGSLSWEIRDLWNAVNWNAARSIWLKNDVANSKLYVGVPLPTPNQWLPNAPVNAAPATPNVILVCDYLGLNSYAELVGEAGIHTSAFTGSLIDIDMRRKWTVWTIPSPNGAFLTRGNTVDKPFFVCNGNASGKVYGFSDAQLTDDGQAIAWNYTTYGFTNPGKAKENPLLGFHRKRYVKLQVAASGTNSLNIGLVPDDLGNAAATWTVWNAPVLTGSVFDYVRNLNITANRVYVVFGQTAAGSSAQISRLILVGNSDLHAPMPNIPGR